MTLLTSQKNNSNDTVSFESKDFLISNSNSANVYTPKVKAHKVSAGKHLSLIDSLFFNSVFKIPSELELRTFNLNQATVIEERVFTKLTLAEAHKLSMRNLQKMESKWKKYLEEEVAKFYTVEDF